MSTNTAVNARSVEVHVHIDSGASNVCVEERPSDVHHGDGSPLKPWDGRDGEHGGGGAGGNRHIIVRVLFLLVSISQKYCFELLEFSPRR
jgi:hypothetical protein